MSPLAFRRGDPENPNAEMLSKVLAAAGSADVVMDVGGLNPGLEGGEMFVAYDGFREPRQTFAQAAESSPGQ